MRRTAGLTLLVVALHRAGGSVELLGSEHVASPCFERKREQTRKSQFSSRLDEELIVDLQHSPPYSTAAMLKPAVVAAIKHASVVQAGTESALGRERTSRESA